MTVTLLHSSAADDEAEEHSITSSRLGGGVAALGALGACLELDGCEVRLCLPCARVRPCVPCLFTGILSEVRLQLFV